MSKDYITGIVGNDQLIISRVISSIENNTEINPEIFKEIHPHAAKATRIGITGPPGAGKSTLIDSLIQNYLEDGKSVGVVAVDPTSPFTGGALLGDRVRMNQFSQNDNVFIRSMGSRGDLGGLAKKAEDVGGRMSLFLKQWVSARVRTKLSGQLMSRLLCLCQNLGMRFS
jgi:LAO/AO transport system kinase